MDLALYFLLIGWSKMIVDKVITTELAHFMSCSLYFLLCIVHVDIGEIEALKSKRCDISSGYQNTLKIQRSRYQTVSCVYLKPVELRIIVFCLLWCSLKYSHRM